jgi:hypothetical protein
VLVDTLFYGSLAEKEGAIPGKRLTELGVEAICTSLIAGHNHRNHNMLTSLNSFSVRHLVNGSAAPGAARQEGRDLA